MATAVAQPLAGVAACVALVAAPAFATPPCTDSGTGWCLERRFAGDVPDGELGFRFGEPLDVDGDGRADVAAGARFKTQQKVLQNGSATVWSGAGGKPIRAWDGNLPDGLFGHWMLPVPDIDADGFADVVIAAPNAKVDGTMRGVLVARSPKTGKEIWSRAGALEGNLGWDLAPAGDQDGDGVGDIFAGAPASGGGRVDLLSGKHGHVLRTYSPPTAIATFGWYVARLDDLDGDAHDDLAVGAHLESDAHGEPIGAAYVISAAGGKQLHRWAGGSGLDGFGEVVAASGDLDGDRKSDVVVAAPRTNDRTRALAGDVFVYSSKSWDEIRHWSGKQAGELYGRMVTAAGDLDGDGVEDLAIGAPWYRRGDAGRAGRVELRSGRSGEILGELVGDEADCWFGWHIRRAPDPAGRGRPALLISSLRHPVDGRQGVGVIDLLVLRRENDVAAKPTPNAPH